MEKELSYSTPEAQGIASSAVLAYIEAAEAQGLELHGLILLRRGKVVAEGWWKPYERKLPHMLYSLSKSFTSTAAGLAIAEKLFTLDDAVVSFFPESLPDTVSDNLKAMKVRDLLAMATGHDKEPQMWAATDGNWIRQFLATPVQHTPGTHFLYNTPATYMVSAIVEKKSGKSLLEYLTPRLFAPLGITGATWEKCPRGITTGGYGLSIRTDDIARFGLLFQQKGVWDGKQLVPENWIAEATKKQVSNGSDPNNDWNQGYGYQFWRCRYGAYRGDGAFGQFCIVMPEQEAVLAITSGVGNMGAVMSLAWQHLLPAMGATPLAENKMAHKQLTNKLARLTVPIPQGKNASPRSESLSGKTYRFTPNDQKIETVTFDFGKDDLKLTVKDGAGTHTVACGMGKWKQSETTFLQQRVWGNSPPTKTCKSAVYGAWKDENTLLIKTSLVETPFSPVLAFRFDTNRVTLDVQGIIGFGSTERALLEGQLS
jgi:CubicO group peptidase (beta-lactamase class C family)